MVVCPERPQKLPFSSFMPYPMQLSPVSSVIVFIKKKWYVSVGPVRCFKQSTEGSWTSIERIPSVA